MTDPNLVLALKKTDDYLHVGEQSLILPHMDVTGESTLSEVAKLEFYDDTGFRLRPQMVQGVATLARVGRRPVGGQRLVARIAVVLAKAQVALDKKPDSTIGKRIPVPQGDLKLVLPMLATLFGELSGISAPPNRGSDYHNWCHKNGLGTRH